VDFREFQGDQQTEDVFWSSPASRWPAAVTRARARCVMPRALCCDRGRGGRPGAGRPGRLRVAASGLRHGHQPGPPGIPGWWSWTATASWSGSGRRSA